MEIFLCFTFGIEAKDHLYYKAYVLPGVSMMAESHFFSVLDLLGRLWESNQEPVPFKSVLT